MTDILRREKSGHGRRGHREEHQVETEVGTDRGMPLSASENHGLPPPSEARREIWNRRNQPYQPFFWTSVTVREYISVVLSHPVCSHL